MSANGPYILVPIKIVDSMVTSSDVTEPASGETAWVSGSNYIVGDQRIRTQTHRVYTCIKDATGRTTAPEDDPMYWSDSRATLKWAMYDTQVTSQTVKASSLTVVIKPGFSNAIALYNLTGTHIEITVKDQTGGAIIKHHDADLYEPFPDWYEWLFAPYRDLKKIILSDITPYEPMEYTITVTNGGGTAGIGMVCVGDLRSMSPSGLTSGTQYGAAVEPVDYSYIKTDDYGNTRIVRRSSTTSLRASVFLSHIDVDYAISLLQEVLAVPVAFVAVDASGYSNANVFGLVSGSVEYAGPNHAIASLNVKGLI